MGVQRLLRSVRGPLLTVPGNSPDLGAAVPVSFVGELDFVIDEPEYTSTSPYVHPVSGDREETLTLTVERSSFLAQFSRSHGEGRSEVTDQVNPPVTGHLSAVVRAAD
ncbi:hypothetical protein A6A08_24405 [Nocardiopsis sp. TSRI0078]|uniref:hypothetical protein n=1 Tax=unclassified Nocardiopsis TaxID=2649073 RepID=UPI00093C0931|nr:hypothetical protein [Nocardiopsis sp. TSRI0078]OKI19764.1 hypothetical protein A6A08_24405 [Nocardiopsis sp. TSRI0078]